MFYKKDSEFKEKGVGTLHLKQTAEGKTQMIIRADTNLGKITASGVDGLGMKLAVTCWPHWKQVISSGKFSILRKHGGKAIVGFMGSYIVGLE